MKIRTLAALMAAGAALGGCQYTAEPLSVPAYNVYSSYESKLPGKYLLYIEADKLSRVIKPSDLNCAAHSYPLELTNSFTGSVHQTFANLVDAIEVVDAPIPAGELAGRGARAMIIVRGEDLNGRLRAVPGFWSVGMETEVELAASILVDGRRGRLLGSTVSGDGHAQADAGGFCEGGADSLVHLLEMPLRKRWGVSVRL